MYNILYLRFLTAASPHQLTRYIGTDFKSARKGATDAEVASCAPECIVFPFTAITDTTVFLRNLFKSQGLGLVFGSVLIMDPIDYDKVVTYHFEGPGL